MKRKATRTRRGEENKKEEEREGERKKPRGGGGVSVDRGGPQVLSGSRFIAGLTLPCIYYPPFKHSKFKTQTSTSAVQAMRQQV